MAESELKRVVVELGNRKQYTYETDLLLKVGDRVLVAISPAWQEKFGKVQVGRVVNLRSDYKGPCQRVLEIMEEEG